MLEMLANSIFIMSKAWCEKNNAAKAQDFTNKEETLRREERHGHGPLHARLARART